MREFAKAHAVATVGQQHEELFAVLATAAARRMGGFNARVRPSKGLMGGSGSFERVSTRFYTEVYRFVFEMFGFNNLAFLWLWEALEGLERSERLIRTC